MKQKCKNLVRRLFWYGYLNEAQVAKVKGTDIPDSVIRLAKIKIVKYSR